MGKSCSFGLQYVLCTMSSLNKGDVHNCRLYVTIVVVVVLGFYVPPTAKVIRRRDLGLKSHPKDWRSPYVTIEIGLNTSLFMLVTYIQTQA